MASLINLIRTPATLPDGGSKVDYLVNDLSLSGQFHELESFNDSVERIMLIRQTIQLAGRSLFCNPNLAHSQVTPTIGMQQAIQSLPAPKRSAWMQWLTKHGPHWDELRQHSPDDWFAVNSEPVTESALAETAFSVAHGLARELVSFDPSAWMFSPINVTWIGSDGHSSEIAVANHWSVSSVSESLARSPLPILSWESLAERVRASCQRLVFSEDAFDPLEGHPFVHGAAERIQILLRTLDDLSGCIDENGQRTPDGDRIYETYFKGNRPWFTDSSETEKNTFKGDLTFRCPDNPSEFMFCTWHGKVNSPKLRVHFSWPTPVDRPIYVVYVGPKITKR